MSEDKLRIGLALSGGGFRAAAFHLGVIKKLNELSILDKIDYLSTISGGSIIGAYYVLNSKIKFNEFEESFKKLLNKDVLFEIFITRNIILALFTQALIFMTLFYINIVDVPLLLVIFAALNFLFLFKIFSFSYSIRLIYDKYFFNKKKIIELPEKPELIINATNLQTGTLMTFTRKEVNDSSYKYDNFGKKELKLKIDKIPISLAVAASTAFPPLIDPVKIKKKYFIDNKDYRNQKPILVDGGLYDNQGIYKIALSQSKDYKADIIICSDASSPFKDKYLTFNPYFILRRSVDILMKRIRGAYYTDAIYKKENAIFEIAYFSINWNYDNCLDKFIINLSDNKIRDNVLKEHDIPVNLLKNKNDKEAEKSIKDYISKKIDFKNIIKNGLSNEDVKRISKISTSLISISEPNINNLIKHAAVLTEIQLKLYCPSLLNK